MKTAGYNLNVATTGVTKRLDILPDGWFNAVVTSMTIGSDGHHYYGLQETVGNNQGFGFVAKDDGLSVGNAQELNDRNVAVGTNVFARFRGYNADGTETYEFFAGSGLAAGSTSGSGGGPDNLTTVCFDELANVGVAVTATCTAGIITTTVTVTQTFQTVCITGPDLSLSIT